MKSIGTKEIQTKRLILRRVTKEDEEALYNNYGKDKNVQRYINYAPCATREGTHDFIEMHLDHYKNDKDFYGWVITFNNEVIGTIGLFNIDLDNEQCEIGYSISSHYWGQGIVSEAAKSVIDYAFNSIKAHRVIGTCHSENIASEKVMNNIGMHYEGLLHDAQKNRDGTYSDLKLYAIINKKGESNV